MRSFLSSDSASLRKRGIIAALVALALIALVAAIRR
jgi:hypothetical protein